MGDTLWAKFGSDTKGALEYLQANATGKVRDAAWMQWQKIVDTSRSQLERARADINFKREEEKRKDPIVGDEATKAWTYYIRQKEQEEAKRTFAERQQEATAKAARDEWTVKIMTSGGVVDLNELANDERMSRHPEQKVELQRFAAALSKEEPPAAVSRKTMADLYARIGLPEGDPRKITDLGPIMQEVGNGKLSIGNFDFLKKALEDGTSADGSRFSQDRTRFLEGVKGLITKSTMLGKDDVGDQNYSLFIERVDKTAREMRKAGKDPSVLFDSSSPEYMGNPGIVSQYQTPLQQQIENKSGSMTRTGGEALGKLPKVTDDAAGIALYERLPSKAYFIMPDGRKAQKP